jgi:hypothetical protein
MRLDAMMPAGGKAGRMEVVEFFAITQQATKEWLKLNPIGQASGAGTNCRNFYAIKNLNRKVTFPLLKSEKWGTQCCWGGSDVGHPPNLLQLRIIDVVHK